MQQTKKIGPLYQRVIADHDGWTKFRKELNVIPEITNSISKIQGELETLCLRIDLLESALTEQTEQVQTLQLESYKQHQLNLTELYRRKKELAVQEAEQELRIAAFKKEQQRLELEKIKATERMNEQMIKAKEKERADRIRDQEILLEREKEQARMREQLNAAFQKELANFKASRTKREKRKKKKNSFRSRDLKPLEQVVISDDDNGLEEFLGDSEESSSISSISEMRQHDSESDEELSSTTTTILPSEQVPELKESPKKNTISPQKEVSVMATDTISEDSSKETDSSEESQNEKSEEPKKPAVVADVDDSWM